ncbi:MAG: hypothetical protein AAF533_22065 [Acidobacteriota bacterium]
MSGSQEGALGLFPTELPLMIPLDPIAYLLWLLSGEVGGWDD